MSQSTDTELRDAAAQAQREAWPYNDPRANYPAAEEHRQQRAEGASRRD